MDKIMLSLTAFAEAWPQQRLEAIGMAIDGINSRVQIFGETLKTALGSVDPASEEGIVKRIQIGATHQGEFDNMSAMALGGFGLAMEEGGGPLAALNAIKPALDVLIPAQRQFNFEVGATAQRLFELSGAIEANRPQFAALEADGQILRGMLQGNLADLGLFKAVSSDITSQIGAITDAGMPMSQALALNQPVLQSLWEAQQLFGFETDEATKALLTQAEQQGIVSAHMKDVNQKILDVLLLIGKALGADIPAALSGLPAVAEGAAAGMNEAFSKVKGPVVEISGYQPSGGDYTQLDVPQMASGGYVPPRRGGTLVNLAEAGEGEYVVPESQMGGLTVNVYGDVDSEERAVRFVAEIAEAVRLNRGGSFQRLNAALGRA